MKNAKQVVLLTGTIIGIISYIVTFLMLGTDTLKNIRDSFLIFFLVLCFVVLLSLGLSYLGSLLVQKQY